MREQTRERMEAIVAQVEAWPGSNLRQIQRATDIPLSTTARLLAQLVDEGRVRLEQGAGYSHYYPAGKGLHKRERVLLAALAKPRPRALLETILNNPGIRHSDLSDDVGLPPPTTTYYLKQLVKKELVLVRASGAQRFYRIKNPEMLEKALERTKGGYNAKIAKS